MEMFNKKHLNKRKRKEVTMKKEQLIEYYRRFRRWQQEGPQYVNRHKDTVQHCQNCGTEFADNYCPRCGQRAGVGRVGWKSVRESITVLWGLDSRSLGSTLAQLLLRPGYLVRDYISGHRQVSYPPVKMLVLVSLLAVVIESVFHVHNEVLGLHFNIPEADKVIQWFNNNKSWGTLIIQSLFILPTWVVFRFAPRYPRHTLPEGFFLQVFLSTLSLLLGFLDYWNGDWGNVVAAIYMIITYRQLFGYSWWGTAWRCLVTLLTAILMMMPLAMLGFLLGNDERKGLMMDIGPLLCAIIVALIAVLLGVTYLISRRQCKKHSNHKNSLSVQTDYKE